MSGKLKIIRALANPKRKTKSAKVKRRKGTRQRAVRSVGGKWVVRMVSKGGSAFWWSGARWVQSRTGARKYSSAAAAADAVKAARKKAGASFVVIDVMPA